MKLGVFDEGIFERKVVNAASERDLSPLGPEMLLVTSHPKYVRENFVQLDHLCGELQS